MPRKHALAVAAILGLAAVAGTFAATRTMSIGASVTPAAPDTQLAQRTKRLDAVEASLARATKDRPPALPPLRAVSRAVASASAPAVRVVYQRPPPIQVLAPSARNHENEQEAENEAETSYGDD